MANIILVIALCLPLALGLLFRVSASNIFFSVMAGELLARYFGDDFSNILASVFNDSPIADVGHIILLIAPMVLTALFLNGSVSKGKAFINIIPLAITGIVFTAFLLPELSESTRNELAQNQIGKYLLDTNSYIIGGVVILQLLALWFLGRGEKHGKKHHK